MPETQTIADINIAEFTKAAANQFCDDLSTMLGVKLQSEFCEQNELTFEQIKLKFEGFALLNTIKSQGLLKGDFILLFDQVGLFCLAGSIVMLPEERIKNNCKNASEDDIKHILDAAKELGNLLAGSWDKAFRESASKYNHFVQSNVAIENLSKVSQESPVWIKEPCLFIECRMTLEPFTPFIFGVVYPVSIFKEPAPPAETETEERAEAADVEKEEENTEVPNTEKDEIKTETSKADNEEVKDEPPNTEKEEVKDETQNVGEEGKDIAGDTENNEDSQTDNEEIEDEVSDTENKEVEPVSEEIPTASEQAEPISEETPSEPTQEPPQEETSGYDKLQEQSAPASDKLADIKIADIMKRELIWRKPQDAVIEALTEMKEKGAGYVLIGDGKIADGIVSNGDISEAISPYMKEKLARYRRPLDEATLQTPLHWVMSKTLVTIESGSTLPQAINKMFNSKKNCLVVTNEKKNVCGIITAYEVFGAILKNNHQLN